MPNKAKLLFVIMDGEHARFVTANSFNALRTEVTFNATHRAELRAATGIKRAIEPRRDDLLQIEKDRFVKTMLDEAATVATQAGQRLVVVAPSQYLQSIEPRLNGLIAGKLAKDLVHVPDHHLGTHLRDWIGPPKRGAML
jgi:hypothetical protein